MGDVVIVLRRAAERRHEVQRGQDTWHTFHALVPEDPLAGGFGALASFNEKRLRPRMRVPQRSAGPVELISYVHQGTLAHEDSLGRSGLIHGGEFQRMSVGQDARRIETNTSRGDWSHVFQIGLRATEPATAAPEEQKRFSTAQRRGLLCVVGSPDGRKGSLRLQLDALLYSAILDAGQHLIHELSPGRSAWLHVVTGEVKLGDDILGAGDGMGLRAARAVSLTARDATEILLLDLS